MAKRSYLFLGLGLALVFAFDLFVKATIYLDHIDWPARPAAIPADLQYLIKDDPTLVANVYVCDLGGFIDREYLWKIEGKPALAGLLAEKLKMHPVRFAAEIPSGIWKQPPCWWDPRKDARVRCFKTQGFVADDRGFDGDHYFMIHDEETSVCYLWVKNNF